MDLWWSVYDWQARNSLRNRHGRLAPLHGSAKPLPPHSQHRRPARRHPPRPSSPAILPGKGLAQHDFFYVGEAKTQDFFIIKDGKVAWNYTIPNSKGEISDATLLSNGNILFAHQYGISILSPDKKIVWNYDAPDKTEIHTAIPIGKDRVLFMENAQEPKLAIINITNNKIEKELPMTVGNPGSVHGHFRHARLTDAGTVLVAHMDNKKVVEYDENGKVVWSYDFPSPWAAARLKNGNTLISSSRLVREVDAAGKTVWEFTPADLPGYKVSGFQIATRLANGNTLINNWVNQWNETIDPTTAPVQAWEVTPEKKIVWALAAPGPATRNSAPPPRSSFSTIQPPRQLKPCILAASNDSPFLRGEAPAVNSGNRQVADAGTVSICEGRRPDTSMEIDMNMSRRTFLVSVSAAVAAARSASAQITGAAPAASPAAGGPTSVNQILTWDAMPGAKGYDVYFGPTAEPAYQCRVTKPTFVLDTLSAATTYHWRADAVTDASPVAGTLQSFTTDAKVDRDAQYFWSIKMANTIRGLYPTPVRLGEWNYTQGMVADALYAIATRTGRDADIDFAKGWADRFVTAEGSIDDKAYDFKLYSLDRVRPGPLLLWLYDHTKDEKYLKAAKYVHSQLDEQPKTSDGGYWHRSTYPNQMWLDGIYMADVFNVEFATKTNQPKYYDDAVKQVTLIHQHTHDPKTGLYYHGWDETKTRPWADKTTGASPEFWGRAIGWYAMAMGDILDWLPLDHPGRKEVLPIFQELCKALLKFQDKETAMWWQIIDKPTGPKNYIETSCSIMFAEAWAKGAQRGWLPQEFLEHARRAARGIMNHKIDLKPNGTLDIQGTVTVGSLGGNGGFYDYYVGVGTATNDQKGLGAFMYLSIVLSETANPPTAEFKEFPRKNP